jgi:hypothetical protein
MNIAPNVKPVRTYSGPSAAATWTFIFAMAPVVLVGVGFFAGWVYGLIAK